jgi:hypothetical protein
MVMKVVKGKLYINNKEMKDNKCNIDGIEHEVVFHGSHILFDARKIRLDAGKVSNDFGLGFYMTRDCEYAARAGRRRVKQRGEKVYLYAFLLPCNMYAYRNIKCRRFTKPTADWLNYITNNREYKREVQEYDIVYGPTADARTMQVLDDYIDGRFGKVGSEKAVKEVIYLLNTNIFSEQICIKSEKALKKS